MEPGVVHVGEYKIKMTLTDGTNSLTKTLHLNVKELTSSSTETSVESEEEQVLFKTPTADMTSVNIG